ncbi:MAG: DEAD/DEAH box helicase [Candidatus Marinimicrobia bacterium]|nr:DEAD/DEAH box helicase [Candidatus Neomarinimicrobiota bacterium]
MEHGSISAELINLLPSGEKGQGFRFKHFHPDLFPALFESIQKKVLLLVPEDRFHSIVKYLEGISQMDGVVFLPSHPDPGLVPSGFVSSLQQYSARAKEVLSRGAEDVNIIVSTEAGLTVPVVGVGAGNTVRFDGSSSFDDCENFLVSENYSRADFVSNPGDYSLRGGIIDVFPKSSFSPYRITFMEDIPSVFRFDVDSQLTTQKTENFVLSSVSQKQLLPLSRCNLDVFYPLEMDADGSLLGGGAGDATAIFECEWVTVSSFAQMEENIKLSAQPTELLSSIGVLLSGQLYVPSHFASHKRELKSPTPSAQRNTLDLDGIQKGDFLVHRDHGIGECLGLKQTISNDGSLQEFLMLKYGDGGVVSVNIGRLDMVSLYSPSHVEGVVLDSITKGGLWKRKKASARKRIEEVVSQLLQLYVKRSDLMRPPLTGDVALEKEFILDFPFEDTGDQKEAWNQIAQDMSSPTPMDRLLCGDVGFGKTEIAIRASFRAVLSGKRVLIMAPTTILANQLYSAFSSRLAPYSINVEMVSRFRTQKDVSKIKQDITREKNDVIVGTHAVLNDVIYHKNMGLMVIDEEHRFGVKHKEKIKGMKNKIDVLSMSATPIPRSMNLAIAGLYSISMLQTPPRLRLPIITQVEFYNESLITETILFEVERGGQVYFIHNNVQNIASVASTIQGWIENIRVEYIHGQEPAKEIEKKMAAFVRGEVSVLVSTSIIETGIDVPGANSIIINNSHLFGLSQLYQMRGRVGRGALQAYAYLLVPRGIRLSEKAFRRIKTIQQNTSLGSGYNISRSDMEIRGAGSLFGYKQSGGGDNMGYEMYVKLVQRSLYEAGSLDLGFKILPEDIVVDIHKNRFIPEDYIDSEPIRMSVYKNLASATDEKGVDNIVYNLNNRFGKVPRPLVNVINEYRLRLLAAEAGVHSIIIRGCGVRFLFDGLGNESYGAAFMNYVHSYWEHKNIEYHIMPSKNTLLQLCVHLQSIEDKYSIVAGFLNKFTASEKSIN